MNFECMPSYYKLGNYIIKKKTLFFPSVFRSPSNASCSSTTSATRRPTSLSRPTLPSTARSSTATCPGTLQGSLADSALWLTRVASPWKMLRRLDHTSLMDKRSGQGKLCTWWWPFNKRWFVRGLLIVFFVLHFTHWKWICTCSFLHWPFGLLLNKLSYIAK